MVLSFITNNHIMVTNAQAAGIDRIMLVLEVNGKYIRQFGEISFFSDHTIGDIPIIYKNINKSSLLPY
jgi:hypothetical protein